MEEIVLDFICHADFSGRLRKNRDNVGFCAFSAHVDKLRSSNPDGTLLLDAGDAFSVNFWGGKPVVGALNRLGTDVMTLGNHEFDHGQEFLEECIAACNFPVLCANIHKKESGMAIAGTYPYVILEKKGIKIGILGLTTEYTPYMVEKSAFLPFEVSSAKAAANHYIPVMRQMGAQVIIVLAHFPFYFTEEGVLSGELWELLESIPQVDICIGGHIPGDYAGVINNTCILKAGFGGASIGHARLAIDLNTKQVTARSCEVLLTDPSQKGSPEIADYIHQVVGPFEEYFSEPLAYAKEHWKIKLASETKLGDFLADCLRFGGQTQLAYMNATSSSGEIEPGPVTRETIIETNGFNDLIFTGEITGQQLYELIEAVYEPERFGNNAALFFSGFHAKVDHTKPSPHKVIRLTLPDGTPIIREQRYSVATSAYMASGGNDTLCIAGKISWKKADMRFYNAAFDYAKHQGILSVEDWPRLEEIGHPENDNSPF